MLEDLRPLIEFEGQHIHYHIPPPHPAQGIVLQQGQLPLLFSAPHACQHKRGGYWKQEDEYTGAIAEWLHRLTNTSALYITHQIDPDPHDDDSQNIYKRILGEFIQQHHPRLVVDLHGVQGDREFGVALGTMNGITCPQQESRIIEIFAEYGFLQQGARRLDTLILNHPQYTGGLRQPTITRFAALELGCPAIQIELNAWIRVLKRLPHSTNARSQNAPFFQCDHVRFGRMMQALTQITMSI